MKKPKEVAISRFGVISDDGVTILAVGQVGRQRPLRPGGGFRGGDARRRRDKGATFAKKSLPAAKFLCQEHFELTGLCTKLIVRFR